MSDDDRLLALERLLSLHAEETRTKLDIQQDKQDRAISMLSEIATQLAELSRSDEQQWHAISDLRRGHKDLVERVTALEQTKQKPRKRK